MSYEHSATCDGCKLKIVGDRYKCWTKSNWDFCGPCFKDRGNKGMSYHNWDLYSNGPSLTKKIKEKRYSHNATCDGCREKILGTRYKCVTQKNFDFCDKCFEKRGEKGMKGHNWTIHANSYNPTGKVEEKGLVEELYKHSATCDGCRGPIEGDRYKCLTKSNFDFCTKCFESREQKGMARHNWDVCVGGPKASKKIEEKAPELYAHSASCDGCRNKIMGVRYQCATKNNFDFCSKCFETRDQKGMKGHNWDVKEGGNSVTRKVVEKAEPVKIEPKPVVEKKAPPPKKEEFVHRASCDGCRAKIKGNRYKCTTKNNYDFCSKCFEVRDQKGMKGHNWDVMENCDQVTKHVNEKEEPKKKKEEPEKKKEEPKKKKEEPKPVSEKEAPKQVEKSDEVVSQFTHKFSCTCDGCRAKVIGLRFKCLSRRNYDFCEKCFNDRAQKKMVNHNWAAYSDDKTIHRYSFEFVKGGSTDRVLEGNDQIARNLQAEADHYIESAKNHKSSLEYYVGRGSLDDGKKHYDLYCAAIEPLADGENVKSKFSKIKEVVDAVSLIASYQEEFTTKPIMRELESYMAFVPKAFDSGMGNTGTLPNTPLNTYFQGAEKLGYQQAFVKKTDDEVFLFVHDLCGKITEKIDEFVKEYPELKVAPLREKLSDYSARSIKEHARHCVKSFVHVQNEKRPRYIKALKRFPLARKYCLKRLAELKYARYERRMNEVKRDKYFSVKDPFANEKIDDAFGENESDYEPYVLIRPAGPDVPLFPGGRKAKNEEDSNTKFWSDLKKKNEGKFVFSKEDIDKNERDGKKFTNKFVFGKDEIYARCYWPHAIYNYSLGKDKKTGDFLYPPERLSDKNHFNRKSHFAEFVVIAHIDGKKYVNKGMPFGEIANSGERSDSDSGVNFWARNQTMKLWVSLKKPDVFDEYQMASQRFNQIFSTLKPGNHVVKLEMCFRVVCLDENLEALPSVFPTKSSLLSHPIAVGEFQIEIPKNAKLTNPLPMSNCKVKNVKEITKEVKKLLRNSPQWGKRGEKQEELIWAVPMDDFYVSDHSYHQREKYIAQYGLNVRACFYRNPQNKWDHEHCRIFKLSGYTPFVEKKNCEKKMPPILARFGVGGSQDIDADVIPEEVYKEYGIKRCPEDVRDYYDDLSDEDKKQMGKDF